MQTKHISGKTFAISAKAKANSGQTFAISAKAQANSISTEPFSNQTLANSGKAQQTLTKTEAISTATLANSTQTFDNYPVAIAFIAAAAGQIFSSTDSSYPTINTYSLTNPVATSAAGQKLQSMNSSQEAKLNMYNAVVTHCAANPAIVATVPAFQTAFTNFQDIFSSIIETAQEEAQVIKGVAMDKAQAKKDLVQKAVDISSSVYAYAVTQNDNTLKEQVNFSLTDLLRLKDEILGPTCLNISNAANDNVANLVGYGITAAVITDFNDMITNYMGAVSNPRNAVTQRATYSASLKDYFKSGDDILKNQMDKIALQFKAANLEFYTTYKNNRIILDAGTSATELSGTVTSAADDSPVSGASVEVIGASITVNTDGNGDYEIKPLPIGTYSVKFTKAGFTDKTVDNVLIKLGQTTTLDVEL